jgi:hypothetical protein
MTDQRLTRTFDHTPADWMRCIRDMETEHAFTTAPLSTEAVQTEIAAKNACPVQPSGPVASRAGSLLGE